MTRKDYVLLAATMLEAKPAVGDKKYKTGYEMDRARRAQWEHDCSKLADTLKAENARFDTEQFLKACGYFSVEV